MDIEGVRLVTIWRCYALGINFRNFYAYYVIYLLLECFYRYVCLAGKLVVCVHEVYVLSFGDGDSIIACNALPLIPLVKRCDVVFVQREFFETRASVVLRFVINNDYLEERPVIYRIIYASESVY